MKPKNIQKIYIGKNLKQSLLEFTVNIYFQASERGHSPSKQLLIEILFSKIDYCIVYGLKGTVQRKLTWVKSGINRQLMICQSVPWYFFILKSLGPFNSNKSFSAA
jgi:hypothetical protein